MFVLCKNFYVAVVPKQNLCIAFKALQVRKVRVFPPKENVVYLSKLLKTAVSFSAIIPFYYKKQKNATKNLLWPVLKARVAAVAFRGKLLQFKVVL